MSSVEAESTLLCFTKCAGFCDTLIQQSNGFEGSILGTCATLCHLHTAVPCNRSAPGTADNSCTGLSREGTEAVHAELHDCQIV